MICALCGAALLGLSLEKIERLPLSSAPLKFDGTHAQTYLNGLAKGFPDRVTYSDQRRKATAWLKEQLRALGYQPKGMLFSEIIDGKEYTDLENVYAEKRGTEKPDEIIVLTGHYDVTDTTHEGAMDDASGVAVVLELARVLAAEQPRRTIIFLLADSEEFGAFWGARAFARDFDRADQIIAVASFDFVAPEKQDKILTLADGLKSGFTPLWLRELALDSLRSLNRDFKTVDFTNFMEFIERAMQIPPADHGAYLAAGIPAFNWVGQTENFAYQMAHYHHTPADVADVIRPESLADFGLGAERLVRSLDELARVPENFRASAYWKITRNLYIPGWAVTLLHILAFIPFLAYSVSRFGKTIRAYPLARIRLAIGNEAKNMGILLGSFLVGYVIMLLLPALQVITQYEAVPATQKSLLLYQPDFLAMALVLLCVGGVYWIFRTTFRHDEDGSDYGDIRHAFHGAMLTLIIILAFLKNTYLGTLLLLPPAYLWTALRARKKAEDRILNGLLLLGGALTFVTMVVVMTTVFHLGAIYWYLFLSTAYGLISAYTVVLFLMAITVLIRLFRSFVL
jgi:flagellar biogenesis protein FliO